MNREATTMSTKSKYWLTLSGLLAAVVLTVGLAPVPLVFVLGGALVIGFLAAGVLYGQFQKDAIRSGALAAPFPLLLAIVAFNVSLLLRGSELAFFLVPVVAAALFATCYVWSIKHGPYAQPRSTNTPT
ncbi:hypothetical protein ASF64_17375 [Arthrobacter sp. Leaf137]|nr:hypothetical protein ASF64_17375 [Arthrobacter sp. Leaf137]